MGKSLILSTLLLSGCQRMHNPSVQNQDPVGIYLFSAGYCLPCKEELKDLNQWYGDLPVSKKERIKVSLYLIAAETASKQASQAYCDHFVSDLHLSFPCKPDKFGKLYSKFYEGGGVPATVVVNLQQEPVKIFAPGKVSGEDLNLFIGK